MHAPLVAQVEYEEYVKGGKLTTSENKKKEKDLLTDTEFRWSNVLQVLWQGAPQPASALGRPAGSLELINGHGPSTDGAGLAHVAGQAPQP